MAISEKAQQIIDQIGGETTKLGDIRKIAKEVKKDHPLAMDLWSTGNFFAMQLAILILEKKELNQALIDQMDADIQKHPAKQRDHLTDWLMANQLMKDKNLVALLETWEDSPSPLQRRIFWYYQARLRWTGKTPVDNADYLLTNIEAKIENEAPEVQWAMNFLAGQIGIFDESRRAKCIQMGEKLGLYSDEVAPKGCTPNYLPEFIRIEVEKRKK